MNFKISDLKLCSQKKKKIANRRGIKKAYRIYETSSTNICITRVLEMKEREKEAGSSFKEIMADNFPYLRKAMYIHVYDSKIPIRFNPEKTSLRRIIIKLSKIKEK